MLLRELYNFSFSGQIKNFSEMKNEESSKIFTSSVYLLIQTSGLYDMFNNTCHV
jgi:hypothetical protein